MKSICSVFNSSKNNHHQSTGTESTPIPQSSGKFLEEFADHTSYRITRTIAEGGMGVVYEAVQQGVEGFEKRVAVKTLHKNVSNDPKFTQMFIEEAKLVANLVHENIVQIYQLSKFNDMYYFVMEYVDGISLHDIISFHRSVKKHIPVKLAVFIASRIARGLAYAHGRIDKDGELLHIVHRDVCSKNILVTSEGLPKLTDFGIAKATNSILQNDDSLMGKLPFMSPEQARRDPLDHRADIYSLGMVLFYMLTNTCARNTKGSMDSLLDEARSAKLKWELLPEDLDPMLKSLLLKMLAADPVGRFQQTAELARELEYFIYKDGYGPTIVTLAEYLNEQMPHFYRQGSSKDAFQDSEEKTIHTVIDRTLCGAHTRVGRTRGNGNTDSNS